MTDEPEDKSAASFKVSFLRSVSGTGCSWRRPSFCVPPFSKTSVSGTFIESMSKPTSLNKRRGSWSISLASKKRTAAMCLQGSPESGQVQSLSIKFQRAGMSLTFFFFKASMRAGLIIPALRPASSIGCFSKIERIAVSFVFERGGNLKYTWYQGE